MDPSQRIVIRDIIKHKWVTGCQDDAEFEALIGESMYPPDTSPDKHQFNDVVLDYMEKVEIDRDKTKEVGTYFITFYCLYGPCNIMWVRHQFYH